MNHDISYYRIIQGINNNKSSLETDIRNLQNELISDFNNTTDSECVLRNGANQQLLITRSTDEFTKKVRAKPDENLFIGDDILYNGQHWLVTKFNFDDHISPSGKMKLCNIVLRWQDTNGTIQIRYGVSDSIYFGDGQSNDRQMKVGDSQMKVVIPMDTNTVLIKRGQRFLIDADAYASEMSAAGINPTAYKVTLSNPFISDLKRHGCIEVTLAEDQFKDGKDNATLMIADYINPSSGEDESTDEPESGWL